MEWEEESAIKKVWFGEGSDKKIFNRGLEIFQKRGAWQERGGAKIEERVTLETVDRKNPVGKTL